MPKLSPARPCVDVCSAQLQNGGRGHLLRLLMAAVGPGCLCLRVTSTEHLETEQVWAHVVL